MNWTHLSDKHLEPHQGDEIIHLDADGQPSEKMTKVKAILSEDRDEELYEVIDNYNQTLIITRLSETSWIEVDWGE